MKNKVNLEDLSRRREQLFAELVLGRHDLASALKAMRGCLGASQADYAELTGVPVRLISQIENGKANPTLESLEKLGRPFGLELA